MSNNQCIIRAEHYWLRPLFLPDYAATSAYPLSDGDQQYAAYGDLMCHFIRDVRKDLKTPNLPFAIGVIGVNGNHTPGLFNAAG